MSDLTDRLRVFACSCEQDKNQCTACEVCDVLDAIDALHQPCAPDEEFPSYVCCSHCFGPHGTNREWPCPTHLLIHPDVPA